MSELVRHDYYDEPVGRQVRRQLERIDREAQVRQAALETRTREDLARVGAEGQVELYRAQQRIRGGYDLADHTVSRATHLNQKINQSSRDNPGLELTLRDIEYKTALGAGMIVYEYMTRR